MSQALESLNSILKYRQERERQKINESMAMLMLLKSHVKEIK